MYTLTANGRESAGAAPSKTFVQVYLAAVRRYAQTAITTGGQVVSNGLGGFGA
jgi:hypothetical protein